MAYKFQNQELLTKLENDLHLLDFLPHSKGDLCSERLKITEESKKSSKYSEVEKLEKKMRHYEKDEGSGRHYALMRNNGLTNVNIFRKGKMITLQDRDLHGIQIIIIFFNKFLNSCNFFKILLFFIKLLKNK